MSKGKMHVINVCKQTLEFLTMQLKIGANTYIFGVAKFFFLNPNINIKKTWQSTKAKHQYNIFLREMFLKLKSTFHVPVVGVFLGFSVQNGSPKNKLLGFMVDKLRIFRFSSSFFFKQNFRNSNNFFAFT